MSASSHLAAVAGGGGMPSPAAARAFAELCEQGIGPPEAVPEPIFEAALTTFLAGRRLDMQLLAKQLSIGRATLYRRIGDRDRLLGEVLWYLTRIAMARALSPRPRGNGVERAITFTERFLRDIDSQRPFQALLGNEPEIALRILTSKHGPVQQGIAAVVERLLEQAAAEPGIRFNIDLPTLAYAVVRIGESFLYSDVIAGHTSNLDHAVVVISTLLRGSVAQPSLQ
jgi:AcrR family transcriptional regulator